MQPQRRAASPAVPIKPNHLKGIETLSLNTSVPLSDKDEEAQGPSSETSNPFDDKFISQTNSTESCSSSFVGNLNSTELKGLGNENRAQSSPQVLIEPISTRSDTISDENHVIKNPFSDPSNLHDKPNLPPRPLLPPRPSGASSNNHGKYSSTSTPNLISDDIRHKKISSSAGLMPVDREKNENSTIFKKPPPLSRISATAKKISGSDGYISSAGGSLQGSGVIKLREDLHIPNCDKAYKSLPIPEHLANNEIHHKGLVRGLAVSGFYIATIGNGVKLWYSPSGESKTSLNWPVFESKIYSINFAVFPPSETPDTNDKSIWIGLEKGELVEIDIIKGEITAKSSSHTSNISHIIRGTKEMVTIDEHGSLKIWLPDHKGNVSLLQRPRALRIQAKPTCAILANGLVWASQGKHIEIYSLQEDADTILQSRIDSGQGWSISSAISALSYNSNTKEVYASHESGKISVYCSRTYERSLIVQATSYKITCMIVIANRIWIGLQTGKIQIFEPRSDGWVCVLDFVAYHNAIVSELVYDDRALLSGSFHAVVISVSDGGHIKLWDGLLRNYLTDVKIRESILDYSSMRPLNVSILTFNIDSRKPSDLDADIIEAYIAKRLHADIFVIGFQELVDLENKGMTAKTFLVGSNKAAKALDSTLDERLNLWNDYLQKLFPPTYSVIHVSQLVGLFQFIISKNTFGVKDTSTTHVKTGMGGLYGNKGAIATRFLIEDSSFCFVNTHLAAHQSHTTERNKDIAQILKDASFPKINIEYHFEAGGDGSTIMDHEHVFWSGDLNYRIDDTRQSVLTAISTCDWPSLWKNDQLLKQKSENKSFGLRLFSEQELRFAPTFKYNRGSDDYDTSEKMRIPAYCDRILYRGDRIQQHLYDRLEIKMSDHRPLIADFTAQVVKIDFSRFSQSLAIIQKQVSASFETSVLNARNEFLSSYFHLQASQAAELLETKPFASFFLAAL